MQPPTALQEILDLLHDDINQTDDALVTDYILVTRWENLDGSETVGAYTSGGLSNVTAAGMLHIAQNYVADDHRRLDYLDDDE
ncbi:hypothetical protein [uncultured Corynebacterium sp.]|uniref:hypothetical protein n=1 Tax=uncultured Corynebacterium sp. TaxID=159447 RepID=UPI002626D2C0|nr:hypothetical protein [uncultured Corynebacterium sp.]